METILTFRAPKKGQKLTLLSLILNQPKNSKKPVSKIQTSKNFALCGMGGLKRVLTFQYLYTTFDEET